MRRVHDGFEYRAQSTDVATDALEALESRRGVCQDFAHVMIAMCRRWGCPRATSAVPVDASRPPGQPRLVGSDASHAWVSVWCPVQGLGRLRSHQQPAALAFDHVTLAWGRDYGDVAPLRGVIRGGTAARPQVQVTVEPA